MFLLSKKKSLQFKAPFVCCVFYFHDTNALLNIVTNCRSFLLNCFHWVELFRNAPTTWCPNRRRFRPAISGRRIRDAKGWDRWRPIINVNQQHFMEKVPKSEHVLRLRKQIFSCKTVKLFRTLSVEMLARLRPEQGVRQWRWQWQSTIREMVLSRVDVCPESRQFAPTTRHHSHPAKRNKTKCHLQKPGK